MRWLHLSVIAIKTFMSSSNTFPSAPGCIALGMKSYSSQRSANDCISKAWWGMLAPWGKYQLPGKFEVNPRPPVIVQLWLIEWFKLITFPRKLSIEEVGDGGPPCGNSHTCWVAPKRSDSLPLCDRQTQKGCFITRGGSGGGCVAKRWRQMSDLGGDQWKPSVTLTQWSLSLLATEAGGVWTWEVVGQLMSASLFGCPHCIWYQVVAASRPAILWTSQG